MTKLKNGNVKSQIHLYSEPKLYNDFKEAIKQVNKENGNNFTISEVLRGCMFQFSNSAEYQQMTINNLNTNGDVEQ